MTLRFFAIQDRREEGDIIMEHIPGVLNPSDDMTKPLGWDFTLDTVTTLWVTMARLHIVNTILVFWGVLFSRYHDLLQSYFQLYLTCALRSAPFCIFK